jgi:ketosteroid isomerase-like protein
MSTSAEALQLAQDYIHFVEVRDSDAVAARLAPHARQVFVMSRDPAHPTAVFDGKDQVLAYTEGLFRKFERLVWTDKDWTVSADGARVFLQAQSDGVARHSGKPYRNTYVLRFDIAEGLITQILEYALDELFLAMETPVFDWDRRAVALAHALPYATSTPD